MPFSFARSRLKVGYPCLTRGYNKPELSLANLARGGVKLALSMPSLTKGQFRLARSLVNPTGG